MKKLILGAVFSFGLLLALFFGTGAQPTSRSGSLIWTNGLYFQNNTNLAIRPVYPIESLVLGSAAQTFENNIAGVQDSLYVASVEWSTNTPVSGGDFGVLVDVPNAVFAALDFGSLYDNSINNGHVSQSLSVQASGWITGTRVITAADNYTNGTPNLAFQSLNSGDGWFLQLSASKKPPTLGGIAGPFVFQSNSVTTAYLDTNSVWHTQGYASSLNNKSAPTTITVGSSPFSYTNETTVNDQVFIDANGATDSVTYNGTAVYGSLAGADHAIILQPGEWITITYSVATPNMKHHAF